MCVFPRIILLFKYIMKCFPSNTGTLLVRAPSTHPDTDEIGSGRRLKRGFSIVGNSHTILLVNKPPLDPPASKSKIGRVGYKMTLLFLSLA